MSPQTIAVVTGANKGIGLAIVRNLALTYPSSSFNHGPFLVYLTSRSKERGEEALAALHKDQQLLRAKALTQDGGLTDIKWQSLDISQTKSIQEFRDFLKKEHPDGIDVLVNNAGIALDGFNSDIVKKTLECNYYGTLESCQSLLPLLKPGGRLVNVSSIASSLSRYSPSLRQAFLSASTVPEITSLMEAFKSAVAAATEKDDGWPSSAYMVSKAGMTGMTGILAREEQERGGKRLINSCCPGWVETDMTKGRGSKSVDEGAKTPVLLALGDIGGKAGGFWQGEREIEW
ncbi:hypothetical protein MMC10_009461 [Thelotrema lepadinum]|nr:hypothetical protein [Thelotrema lepadinum]